MLFGARDPRSGRPGGRSSSRGQDRGSVDVGHVSDVPVLCAAQNESLSRHRDIAVH